MKFPVRDDNGKLGRYCDLSQALLRDLDHHPLDPPRQPCHRLNADSSYALLQVPSGEVYILAKALAGERCKAAHIEL